MAVTSVGNRQVIPYTITTVTASSYNDVGAVGDRIILANSNSNNITINLPTAVGNTSRITIKKIAIANTVTVDASGTELIDDGLTAIINNQYESITLVSNNSNWYLI